MRERLRGDQNAKKRLIINETAENFLIRCQDNLKRVFEIYCSLGEPMNTEKLKSAKALKLFKDCILVRTNEQGKILELSDERIRRYKRIVPLTNAQIDLVFTQLTSKPNLPVYDSKNDEFNMNTSQMFRSKMGQTSMMDKSIMSSR